jgi:hypothetical protein
LAVTARAIGQEEALPKPQATRVINVRINPSLQKAKNAGCVAAGRQRVLEADRRTVDGGAKV